MARRFPLRLPLTVLVVVLLMVLAAPGGAPARPAAASGPAHPFQDPSLSVAARVNDLLGRLTLDEKLGLLHQSQKAIPRLGIPYFKSGTEALHGVAWSNDIDNGWQQVFADRATVFPQAVGLASTWDPDLMERVGSAVGDEARAYNEINPSLWGLQLWAPVVNLLRDPRWGRNEEGYSEDPQLTGVMSTRYGRGLSGNDPKYLKTAPILKHFYAYNNETNRNGSSSNVPPRIKNEYDLRAFRPAIEANAATGVMASYNEVNGRPTHVDRDLNDQVRSWTDQTLYNVSDAWGPHAVTQSQHFYDDETQAYASVLKAGLDGFTVDDSNPEPMIATLKDALARGLLTVSDIDKAVRHVLTIRTRLGQFDPDGGPFGGTSQDVLDSPAHRKLNREAAEDAMVLLRNKKLPLDPGATHKVAVVGPLSDTLFSDWYGSTLPYAVTPLEGIRKRLGDAANVSGVEALDRVALKDSTTGRYLAATGTNTIDMVTATATDTSSDAAQWDVNDWMGDVSTLRNADNGRYLTGSFGPYNTSATTPSGWYVQQQFRFEPQADGTVLLRYVGYETNESWWSLGDYVTVAADGAVGTGTKAQAAHFERKVTSDGSDAAAAAAASSDAAVVVVGSNPFVYGRENHDRTSMALGASQQELIKQVRRANPNTIVVLESSYPTTMAEQPDSLLWTTHAGSETGNAVAATIFGDHDPSGRLTQTWYGSESDLPPDLYEYDIAKTDQTYLYFRGDPLYAFGHGLSYTSFDYSRLRPDRTAMGSKGTVRVSVDVTNSGGRAGSEVVQLYSHQRTSRDKQPLRELEAFRKVTLSLGQTKTVTFRVPAAELAHWDVTRDRWVVETSTYDLMVGSASDDIRLRAAIKVNGETIPPRNLSRPTQAENFDDYKGIDLVPTTRETGTSVATDKSSGWVKYASSRTTRAMKLSASVARSAGDAGTLEVRVGSPTGPVVGKVTVPSTGDRYSYRDVTADVHAPGGVQDLYLVLGPGVRLADFTLS